MFDNIFKLSCINNTYQRYFLDLFFLNKPLINAKKIN